MSIHIAHISDLHFGMDGQGEAWRLLSQHLRSDPKPSLVLALGVIREKGGILEDSETATQL